MTEIIGRHTLAFYTVDGNAANNTFTMVAGVAGWVDIDISGSDVPSHAKVIFWVQGHAEATAAACGIRRNGDTQNQTCIVYGDGRVSYIYPSGHSGLVVEGYRIAAHNLIYRIVGYLA